MRNLDLQTGDGKDATTRLGEIARQLEQAKLELREAENARDAARVQLDAEKKSGGSAPVMSLLNDSGSAGSIATPEIDSRIETQKRNLDTLLQRYTDQHPDVLAARRMIRDLEEQRRKEIVELRRAAASAPAHTNAGSQATASLAQQEMNRLLAGAEVQVASLKARVAEYSARHAAARAALKTAPQIEAEAAQLNRDYAIVKKNYEDLVARRQSAVMSGELDVASGVADFRLIDPPRVTPRPVFPNRLLLLPFALAAAALAGLAVAFVGSQLRPVFSDAHDLRAKTGLPLLGVISMSLTDAERVAERRGMIRFFGASAGLVGVFVVGLIAMAVAARQMG